MIWNIAGQQRRSKNVKTQVKFYKYVKFQAEDMEQDFQRER